MAGLNLNSSMRATLLSLQNTAKPQDLTSNRLASGLKFSTAIDNPSAFYTAQSLSDRAGDLNILLDAMSQGIQTLKAVAETIQTAQALLGQAAAVANQALSEAENVIARVSTEEELLAAVNSGRSGMIVVENDIDMSQTVLKLADGQSLVGKSYFSSSGSAVKIKASSIYAGEKSLSCLADKMDTLREYDASFGYCHNILTIRQNFTEKMINILEEGADKLVLADMNQESANMLALQTRSLLAVNALSLASRAARSVLKLF